jgi:enoyl-CoA hydratase
MIAAVEGGALAGGFELVLACDLVVAGRSARVGVPEVKRALVAAGGGALLLASRVPRALALEMLLTGEPVDAGRAAAMGLVNRVLDDGGALEAAVELATAIAANGPLAVATTKRVAAEAVGWAPAEMWDRQQELIGPIFTSEDAREGAAAFAEKRAPVWKGR